MEAIIVSDDTAWQPEDRDALSKVIARLEEALPGWWWSVGSCHVSSHASIGPDRIGPDAMLLHNKEFDEGFHADLPQPSTCAEALNAVIYEASELLKFREGMGVGKIVYLNEKAKSQFNDSYNRARADGGTIVDINVEANLNLVSVLWGKTKKSETWNVKMLTPHI